MKKGKPKSRGSMGTLRNLRRSNLQRFRIYEDRTKDLRCMDWLTVPRDQRDEAADRLSRLYNRCVYSSSMLEKIPVKYNGVSIFRWAEVGGRKDWWNLPHVKVGCGQS